MCVTELPPAGTYLFPCDVLVFGEKSLLQEFLDNKAGTKRPYFSRIVHVHVHCARVLSELQSDYVIEPSSKATSVLNPLPVHQLTCCLICNMGPMHYTCTRKGFSVQHVP